MFRAIEKWIGKIDFDLGSEEGTRPLSNKMTQEQLERIYRSPNGPDYVEVVPESEKKKGEEVSHETL
ncbi:hypothetical protein [Runella zeae]|uniref:hypothetical protein n=1 Tax=Runella zeae TaxID=94255 RepID=UPI00235272D1|nr:hypothetical protein [Runella zeae]